MKDTYFSIGVTFCQLAESDHWTVTIHSHGDFAPDKDSRWLGVGPMDRFNLHDILKVTDCRIESALIKALGLQTVLDLA